MRHLFVTNDFPPKTGGIESYLINLCAGLRPADVTVVAPSRKGHEDVDAALPYRVVRLPGSYLRARSSVGKAVVEAARECDAVHFLHALPLGRLGSRVTREAGKPYTVVAHGSEVFVPARAPLVRRVLRRVLRSAAVVYAVSEYTAGAVEAITGDRDRIAIVSPSVDVRRFSLAVSGADVRERYKLGSAFVLLFVGRLVKRKGAEALVKAAAGMKRTGVIVVGTGPEEQTLRRLVEDLEIERRIVFAGAVRDDELPAYYAAADVFCMPCSPRYRGADTEGFGVVFLEAAATGLPSVTGACGGAVEAVLDGVTGVVLDDTEPDRLREALERLRDDEVRRTTMGAAGRARAEAEYTPEVQARRLELALEAALSGPASRAS